jgi:hypothetical protein
MPQDHNRNIIMEINNGLSLAFYELPDGAEKMESVAGGGKNHGVGAWRLMPLVSVLLSYNLSRVLLDFTETTSCCNS